MHNTFRIYTVILMLLTPLFSCAEDEHHKETVHVVDVDIPDSGRWYTTEQVTEGRKLFSQYCAACHGPNAESTPEWKTPTESGHFPPPPLNGSAHAWHHPLAVLDQVIRDGGAPFNGIMPAWGAVLDQPKRLALIASFQDYWTDEIYETWKERELFSREGQDKH